MDKPVELFERGGGWVAAGNAEQWAYTHERLESYRGSLIQTSPFKAKDLARERNGANRMVDQSYEAIFRADQYGRVSIELFTYEADAIKAALA